MDKESNINLRAQIFKIVKNQIRQGNPPETKHTYYRLIQSGLSQFEAKQLIGQCLAVEISGILNAKKPFDEKRYIKNLKNLPKEPF